MLLLSTWGKYHLYFIVSHSVIIEIQLRGDCLTKPAALDLLFLELVMFASGSLSTVLQMQVCYFMVL